MRLVTTTIFCFLFIFASAVSDTNTVINKINQSKELLNSMPQKSILFAKQALALSLKTGNKKFEAKALNALGSAFYFNSEPDSSIYYHSKALEIQIELKDPEGIGRSYTNLGSAFDEKNFSEKAINYFILAEKEFLKCNYKLGLGKLYNSMGNMFYELEDFKNSETYYLKGKEIANTTNDDRLAYSILSNLGNCYDSFNEKKKSLGSYIEAYNIAKKLNHLSDIVVIGNNICSQYCALGNFHLAENYCNEALSIINTNKLENYLKKSAYINYAMLLRQKGKYETALLYLDSVKFFAQNDGEKIITANNFQIEIYTKLNQHQKANEILMYNSRIKDSINELKLKSKVNEINTAFQTEKKDLQIQKTNKDLADKQSESKRKTIVLIIGGCFLILSISLLFISVINYKRAKKANTIINNQKQTLEHQKKEVERQKQVIEEKQHEIISSITYAQRIQSAVLTGEDVWNKVSKAHFIVFQPRDIVSGDFYWAHVLPNGRAVFALADCTGHGVPGGFMSMLGNSFLNELVVENKLFKANEILNRLREKVISALFQKGQTQQKDGMDMALCVWNKMDNTLEFAGANNALYLVRDGELIEYKGDKMPIGTYLEENKPFTSQVITLKPNDMIYLTTDGFADQFGGEKGKKFKYKQFESLLIEIATGEPQKQKETLTETFKQWKSNYEQTDDMSVIGIKVS